MKGLSTGGSTNTLASLKLALADPQCHAIYLLTDGRPDQVSWVLNDRFFFSLLQVSVILSVNSYFSRLHTVVTVVIVWDHQHSTLASRFVAIPVQSLSYFLVKSSMVITISLTLSSRMWIQKSWAMMTRPEYKLVLHHNFIVTIMKSVRRKYICYQWFFRDFDCLPLSFPASFFHPCTSTTIECSPYSYNLI